MVFYRQRYIGCGNWCESCKKMMKMNGQTVNNNLLSGYRLTLLIRCLLFSTFFINMSSFRIASLNVNGKLPLLLPKKHTAARTLRSNGRENGVGRWFLAI